MINRRELLQAIAVATGAAFVYNPAYAIWKPPAAATSVADSGFNAQQVALIEEICETVIPRTDTPGAKDAGLPAFVIGMIRDCYTPTQQALFEAGMANVETRSQLNFGKSFTDASDAERTELLSAIDSEALAYNKGEKVVWEGEGFGDLPHYFTLFKQLIIFGFFTSKEGGTEVLRHVEIPGTYKDIPYKEGDRDWATVWPT